MSVVETVRCIYCRKVIESYIDNMIQAHDNCIEEMETFESINHENKTLVKNGSDLIQIELGNEYTIADFKYNVHSQVGYYSVGDRYSVPYRGALTIDFCMELYISSGDPFIPINVGDPNGIDLKLLYKNITYKISNVRFTQQHIEVPSHNLFQIIRLTGIGMGIQYE